MNLDNAIAAVQAGARARCEALPSGAVIVLSDDDLPPRVRVSFEATGGSFDFAVKPEYQAADWRLVEGWAL